jgi:hypothetical protein
MMFFDEFGNFNKETMVSRLNFALEQMVLHQDPNM